MDYERKYKEALENLKSKMKDFKEIIISRKDVEEIFPELADSEDERIRKEILDYIDKATGCKRWITWLEKQGEQKFHEGDWIVINGFTILITDVRNDLYDTIFVNGEHRIYDTSVIDKDAHLWTIEDAKDGNVLYSPEHNLLWIYKSKEECHVAINLNYAHSTSFGSDIVIPSDVCPATKEQRDTMEKAMADAGFTFDFDKKELKKIEHDVQLTEFEEAVKDLMNDCRDAIGDDDATVEEVKEHAAYMLSLNHQNPAWSEEDTFKVQRICKYLDEAKKYYADIDFIRECMEWLKSLKDRVQQKKQEWSEECERIYKSITYSFAHNHPLTVQQQEFVKSLKPQSTWKPSDAQMASITCAVRKMKESACYDSELVSLYQDLKKLMKE